MPALFALIVAALLEVGGDAVVRYGLRETSTLGGRVLSFGIGAVMLLAYSLSVNAPKWNFGRLLGVYIAVFFLVAQVVAVVAFRETPRTPTLVGGALIIAGGLVMTFWKAK